MDINKKMTKWNINKQAGYDDGNITDIMLDMMMVTYLISCWI